MAQCVVQKIYSKYNEAINKLKIVTSKLFVHLSTLQKIQEHWGEIIGSWLPKYLQATSPFTRLI